MWSPRQGTDLVISGVPVQNMHVHMYACTHVCMAFRNPEALG